MRHRSPPTLSPGGAEAYSRRWALMDQTGIGFAGLDGTWWRPAREAFALPQAVADELQGIGGAIFLLFDVLQALYRADGDPELGGMLRHKVPAGLQALVSQQPVLSVRPDFQLQPRPGGRLRPVLTELEICPSAHGFAHAMQLGYGLETDLLQTFLWLLGGRPMLFAGTVAWSEFIWEQLAFCRALAEAGGQGWVLYDQTMAQIAESVRAGRRWQPPMFGLKRKLPGWNDDVAGRLEARQLARFCWPDAGAWPDSVGGAVVFRFGYLEHFGAAQLSRFQQWAGQGTSLINPISFILDSKVLMATLGLPAVRAAIAAASEEALGLLDQHVPATLLLQQQRIPQLVEERPAWIVKYAGFDGGDQAWGGRSLAVGAEHTAGEWRARLQAMADLPWPVVAQRLVPSLQQEVAYVDRQGRERLLRRGQTRLRAFFARRQGEVRVGGVHVTLAGGGRQVSESSEAVQAPVKFV